MTKMGTWKPRKLSGDGSQYIREYTLSVHIHPVGSMHIYIYIYINIQICMLIVLITYIWFGEI